MLDWMKNKLQSGRLAATNLQLALELEELSPSEVASVVIGAIEFCLAFRESEDGFFISKAIEEPSTIHPSQVKEIYGQLEDILISTQAQDQQMLERAKDRFGASFEANFSKRVARSNTSLRLLMSRISRRIGADPERIAQISRCLRPALPMIDQEILTLQSEHSALGTEKDASYYSFVRNSAYGYAATYPM